MPPPRTKRDRASGASSKGESSKAVAIQSPKMARTPDRDSRQQERPIITAAQKQALIDNLQLEVTERARKLRAQYALHAHGLKSRLEMRINRIPMTLRSTSIVTLIDKYSEQLNPSKPQALATSQAARPRMVVIPNVPSSSPARRVLKRDSSEMMGQSDKENAHVDLDMPKKRLRTAGPGTVPAPSSHPRAKAASRQVDPSKVLSPKSHNSRTLPHSPIKAAASPGKSGLARPISPVKPGIVAAATASLASIVNGDKSRANAPSRAASKTTGSTRGRRGGAMAPPPPPPVTKQATRGRAASSSSQNSDASAGTTIVRKAVPSKKAVAKTTTTAKRAAAAKKEIPAPSASGAGGRTLRARR